MQKKNNIPDDMLQRMRVKGRIGASSHINAKSENGGFFQTLVIVPSPDNFSHPSTYGVNASSPLGPDGQDVDVVCEVRPYNRKNNGRLFCNNSLWLDVSEREKEDTPF